MYYVFVAVLILKIQFFFDLFSVQLVLVWSSGYTKLEGKHIAAFWNVNFIWGKLHTRVCACVHVQKYYASTIYHRGYKIYMD